MPFIRQTNFLGGELSSLLWGRTDLELFGRGLRRMRNFFPSQQGAAVSRPGTLYVGPTKDQTSAKRLMPYVYSDTESFAIEVGLSGGRLYFRFHQNGATVTGQYLNFDNQTAAFTVGLVLTGAVSGAKATIVGILPDALQLSMLPGPAFVDNEHITDTSIGAADANATLHTLPLEVSGGITNADLSKLKFAQVGAVITLVHPDFPPLELRRLANVDVELKWQLSSVAFKMPDPYFRGDPGGYPALKAPLPVADVIHPGREWIWLVTIVAQDTATGRVFETAPRAISNTWDGTAAPGAITPFTPIGSEFALYPDQPITIWRKNAPLFTIDAPGDTSYRELSWRIYRGRGTVFGLVGETEGSSFVDVGAAPDLTQQPPFSTNPFLITDPAGATSLVHPSAVAFFQERRCFALGGQIWCSATGDYTNYDRHVYQVAGEALYFELAARRLEEAVHLVASAKLLVNTRSSAWSFGGAVAGGALDFDSVDARLEDEVGSLEIAPVTIGGLVLVARAKGLGVRELSFDGNGGYKGADISEVSAHLFKGESNGYLGVPSSRKLKDWCYQEDPFGLVWAVRADGQLLSLTQTSNARGWARHDTNGWVQSICSVPEGEEDAVYMVIARPNADYPLGPDFGPFGTVATWNIERMASRVRRGNADDDCCVDAALKKTIFQFQLAAGPPTITGLDHLANHSVWVVGVGNVPYGPLPVQQVNIGSLMAPNYVYQVTLPEVPTPNSGGYTAADVAAFGHQLHFGGDFVCYVGLAFTAELETLDVAEASVRTKAKITKKVGFELDEARGVKAGQFFDNLHPLIKRKVSAGYAAPVPETNLFAIPVDGGWGLTGRAALRQELPLPVTVVGLVREVVIGDE